MTWTPTLEGRIERRLLVNYRVDPEHIGVLLPAPFRPNIVNGYAVAGVCFIRLGEIRPRGLPRRVGLRSENAAHRVAVEWDEPGGTRRGVYIPRRDTSSIVSAAVGDRLFPGTYQRARFSVAENASHFDVSFVASDRSVRAATRVVLADDLGDSKLFADLDEASEFFQAGSTAYSATRRADSLDGIELRTPAWRVEPAHIQHVRSSVLDDPTRFPGGTAEPDCALVMLGVPVEWHPLASMLDSDARESRQGVLQGI